jgi:hypothetical protein
MTIPVEQLQKWKELKSHGDLSKISKDSGIHIVTLSNVFRKGACSPKVYDVLSRFYAERVEIINQYV